MSHFRLLGIFFFGYHFCVTSVQINGRNVNIEDIPSEVYVRLEPYIDNFYDWRDYLVTSKTRYNSSLNELNSNKVVQSYSWGSMDNVRHPKHSKHRNSWSDIGQKNMGARYLKGITFYVNEFMTVGHALMDIEVIQVLQSSPVARIILQRAPCVTPGLCDGIGTWYSFFQSLYAAMIDAFRPGIPIYIRFKDVPYLTAYFLSISDIDGSVVERIDSNNRILLDEESLSFEQVVRTGRALDNSNENSMSNEASVQFRRSAYKRLKAFNQSMYPLLQNFSSPDNPISVRRIQSPLKNGKTAGSSVLNNAIIISYAYRQGKDIKRRCNNVDLLLTTLATKFPPPTYLVRGVPCSRSMTQIEQMRVMVESNVVITEHGAFLSNLIYMRQSSLLVMLRGNYYLGMDHDFRTLHCAQVFGVYMKIVLNDNMKDHEQIVFEMKQSEADLVGIIVEKYLNHTSFS